MFDQILFCVIDKKPKNQTHALQLFFCHLDENKESLRNVFDISRHEKKNLTWVIQSKMHSLKFCQKYSLKSRHKTD